MKGEQIKRYNPKTTKRHKAILEKCTKTVLTRISYVQNEKGEAEKRGIEVLATHKGPVYQEVRKAGVMPVNRIGYKAKFGKSYAKNGINRKTDERQFAVMNDYSKESIRLWNEPSKKR